VAVLDDTKSFEQLFRIYYRKLYRFAYAILKDKRCVEEVVSDVFMIMWKNRSRLLEIENLNNYLYITTRNLATRYSVTRNRQAFFQIEEMEIMPDSPVKTPEEILLNNELLRQYAAAVNSLPVKCQTIYRLAKQDGLRYKEIAAILNISVKTINTQLAIAAKKITESVQFMYKAS